MAEAFHSEATETTPSGPPDVVALWQRLSRELGDVEGTGLRGEVRLGIVDTLSACDALPFWHGLFRRLGFSIVSASHLPAGINDARARGRETIPSESVCYPAKISHIRVAEMIERGANAVFFPIYDRYTRCPVSCEYANALAGGMPRLIGEPGELWRGPLPSALSKGMAVLVSPLLVLRKPWNLTEYPQEIVQLMVALNAVLPPEAAIGADELIRALMEASEDQERFQRAIDEGNARALAWSHEPGHHGILLVGRPYHWDESLVGDVNLVLARLGFAVMTSHPSLDRRKRPAGAAGDAARWGMGGKDKSEAELVRRAHADRAARRAGKRTSGPIDADPMEEVGARAVARPFWFASKHAGRLCRAAAEDPDLDVVCLQSFGCGYDAASIPEAREITLGAGKPFTLLMIDDSVSTAHLVIRLRTLAAAIRQRKASSAPERPGTGAAGNAMSGFGGPDDLSALAQKARARIRRVAPELPEAALRAARGGSVAAYSGLDGDDYEVARVACENYCYIVAALVGRTMRLCAALPDLDILFVPYVCQNCLLDALPRTVSRMMGRTPTIVWERNWPVAVGGAGTVRPGDSPEGSRPLVGIVGAPPLVYDAVQNDGLLQTILDEGCQPVLPRLDLMLADDVTYRDQLEVFAEQGVSHVIYLISFGCLKGHTQVRCRLGELRREFPDMGVTVIDFDGDASSLNRRNRVYLALASAKDAFARKRAVGGESPE